ncbi:MAG TPA: outer membrane beta-barrel protein [Candidatus Solibacter sp.]
MRLPRLVLAALLATCSFGFAQSFEASVGGGQLNIPSKNAFLGTAAVDPNSGNYTLKSGFRLVFRMTLNSWRFMGHEFGYAYNRTSLDAPATTAITGGIGLPGQPSSTVTLPAQNISIPAHQGFYDFLVYAVPEGKIIRPFACGGVQFTAFSQPGSYYGNRETKYGINYGGGLKVKVKENWGFRLDARQYNMGKPFNLPNASGRLLMWEFSGAVSFLM